MGLDATPIGIQLFFIIFLPGFIFFVSFRYSAGFNKKVGEIASLCSAALFGVLLFWFIQAGNQKDIAQFNLLLANPLSAGITFVIISFVLGVIVGLVVRGLLIIIRKGF